MSTMLSFQKVAEIHASFEEFKDYIDYEQEQYDKCIKEYGFVDPSSPFEVHIGVVDDTVIRVYSMAHEIC